MLVLEKYLRLSYNDVTILPAVVSDIASRSECNPYYLDGFLPLFTAPMSTVVDLENYDLFEENKIHAILPRNIDFETRIFECIKNNKWVSFSLGEFEKTFINDDIKFTKAKVLIDVANGHMKRIFDLVKEAKQKYKDNLIVMIGNIANPQTYNEVLKCGADYVRVGIGGGCGCITSTQTGIHMPSASLIEEVCNVKRQAFRENSGIAWNHMPKIIADGGIRNYSDVIKALALGADYVMIGSVFAKMLESAGKVFYRHVNTNKPIIASYGEMDKIIQRNNKFWLGDDEVEMIKIFYGMASKKGQDDLGLEKKTAEGTVKELKVEYTMTGWVENMTDYLKSAMSYCDCKDVSDFRYKAKVIPISNNSYMSINK